MIAIIQRAIIYIVSISRSSPSQDISERKKETIKIPRLIKRRKNAIIKYFLLITVAIEIGSIWSFLIFSSMFFLIVILEMIMNRTKISLELFFGSMDQGSDGTYRNSQYIRLNVTFCVVIFMSLCHTDAI